MKITGLDHRGIKTDKLEASLHFYVDLLGLEQGHRPEALVTAGYWLYAGENPIVHLIESSSCPGERTSSKRKSLTDTGGQTHLALTVEDARSAVDRLVAAGIPYWDRLFRNPIMYQVFIEDPNGLLIELIDRNPGEISGSICTVVDK